jgi:hypothetical protein
MDFLKKNTVSIAIVLTVLILVLIRSFGTDHFKSDAIKWAEPSFSKANIVSFSQIANLTGEKLIVNLGSVNEDLNKSKITVLNISPASILDKNNIRLIKKHKGPVLLFSAEVGVSAKLWMILCQLGIKNIFILTNNADNEALKYKLRIDATIKSDSKK